MSKRQKEASRGSEEKAEEDKASVKELWGEHHQGETQKRGGGCGSGERQRAAKLQGGDEGQDKKV